MVRSVFPRRQTLKSEIWKEPRIAAKDEDKQHLQNCNTINRRGKLALVNCFRVRFFLQSELTVPLSANCNWHGFCFVSSKQMQFDVCRTTLAVVATPLTRRKLLKSSVTAVAMALLPPVGRAVETPSNSRCYGRWWGMSMVTLSISVLALLLTKGNCRSSAAGKHCLKYWL